VVLAQGKRNFTGNRVEGSNYRNQSLPRRFLCHIEEAAIGIWIASAGYVRIFQDPANRKCCADSKNE